MTSTPMSSWHRTKRDIAWDVGNLLRGVLHSICLISTSQACLLLHDSCQTVCEPAENLDSTRNLMPAENLDSN